MYYLSLLFVCFAMFMSAFTYGYKAIIFDMGNVLVPSKKNHMHSHLSEYCGVKKDVISEYIDGPGRPLRKSLLRGDIDFKTFWEHFSRSCNIDVGDEEGERIFMQASLSWYSKQKSITDMYGVFFAKLNDAGIILGLMANTDRISFEAAKKSGVFEYFEDDLLLVSYQVRANKPEDKIYDVLKEKLSKRGILPNECLFVDDKFINIAAAKKKGFQVHEFKRNIAWEDNQKEFITLLGI